MLGYNYIFHLAAMLGVQATEDDKLSCLRINIDGTKNVLDAAVHNNAEHFIFLLHLKFMVNHKLILLKKTA